MTPIPPKHFGPLKGGMGGWVGGGTKNTNRYLVPRLSFEGKSFKEQQTRFVPICPHGVQTTLVHTPVCVGAYATARASLISSPLAL